MKGKKLGIDRKILALSYIREIRPTLTYPFLRQMVRLPTIPPGLTISLARSKEDLEAAFRLLHDVYVEIGFMEPHPSGLRLSVYNAIPQTSVAVAKMNGKVIGTLSLIRDNPLGLPLDQSIDTGFYRKPGWQVGEVSGLAVSPEWRGQGQVLFPLLKFIYNYATTYAKLDVLQIATALTKEDFFRALLFFEPISEMVFRDPFINGNTVSPLYLDLNNARTLFKRAYGDRGPRSDLHGYFTDLELPNFQFPERKMTQTIDPVWTPELFKYFFQNRTNLFERMSDREIHALQDIYRLTPMEKHLPQANSNPPHPPRRSAQRHPVMCQALLESDQGDEPVTLLDVSPAGFRIFSKLPMRLEGICHFRVQITPQQTLLLSAKPIWNKRRREWGLSIVEAPLGWAEFLNHLSYQLEHPKAA